ncbi:MAG: hypothetical protein ABSC38_08605, partial [Verrucomicrobiia bacterium]
MKRITRPLMLTVGLTALLIGAGNVMAQDEGGGAPPPPPPSNTGGNGGNRRGGGNFDPAQMQQQMLERYKERLEVTNDEWTVIKPLVEKVMQARREAMSGMRGPRRGGDNAAGNGGRPAMGPAPSPEAEALQQALDSKAASDVLKAKLATFRDAHKTKEAALTKAQEDLRKVLTVRQEATAT